MTTPKETGFMNLIKAPGELLPENNGYREAPGKLLDLVVPN